jgi:hypothetical protein
MTLDKKVKSRLGMTLEIMKMAEMAEKAPPTSGTQVSKFHNFSLSGVGGGGGTLKDFSAAFVAAPKPNGDGGMKSVRQLRRRFQEES